MVEETVNKTVELFETLGIAITVQQGFHIIEFLLYLFSYISLFLSSSIITGSNVLLGQPYGKTHIVKGIIKYLSLLIFVVLFLALIVLLVIDYVSNFFSNRGLIDLLLLFLTPIIGVFLIVHCLQRGERIADHAGEKRDALYANEINAILMNNPVFVEALNKIKNDDKIKTVIIFRDGISFHTTIATPPEDETIKISNGALNNSEASTLLSNKKKDILKQRGSVSSSFTNNFLLYSSYGFSSSETAMSDLAKWLYKYLGPRFSRGSHRVVLDYKGYLSSGSTGYLVHNNQIIPTGSSSKTISAYESFILTEILYTTSNSNEPPKQYKKW